MAKIMLVEDDNSLREIYEARLAAEGYSVVAAKDGEEALAMALKEHPDLIIADIMMPKVSGFDMLDILRSTPETKNTKIIMMTALSQAEDKARAERLGADRYLVKSQVTLEDVTREARTILDAMESQAAATVAKVESSQPAPAPSEPAPVAQPAQPVKVTVAETPKVEPEPADKPAQPVKVTVAETPADSVKPTVTSIPVVATDNDESTENNGAPAVDEQLGKAAKDLSIPVKKEEAEVKEQVDEFIASNPTLSTSPEPGNPDKPDNTAASDAVDSLTKPTNDTKTETKDDSDRSYVAQDSGEKPTGSLAHTKTIEPTFSANNGDTKPSLSELLAREGESINDEASPAVSSIISPDNTGGTPPAS